MRPICPTCQTKIISEDEALKVGDTWYHFDCVYDLTVKCHDCEERIFYDEAQLIITNSEEYYICNDCFIDRKRSKVGETCLKI